MPTENRPEIDCGKLKELKDFLHPDTEVLDLEPKEKAQIFPELRERWQDYQTKIQELQGIPGGTIYAASIPDPTNDLGAGIESKSLASLYEENCVESELL